LVYQHGDKQMQAELVGTLLRTFTSGARKITGDTEIEINTEKAEFATYRELCNVANEVRFHLSCNVFCASIREFEVAPM